MKASRWIPAGSGSLSKPKARNAHGKGRLSLDHMTRSKKNGEGLAGHVFETTLDGRCTRNYALEVEAVGNVEALGISKSSIGCRFGRITQEALTLTCGWTAG